jgi:hypothetical protein
MRWRWIAFTAGFTIITIVSGYQGCTSLLAGIQSIFGLGDTPRFIGHGLDRLGAGVVELGLASACGRLAYLNSLIARRVRPAKKPVAG